MSVDEISKEQRILRMVKRVLTDIAKDTMTPPGMKHPLSDNTIQGIRDCLDLITSRETEILAEKGKPSQSRPVVAGEPQKNVVVNITRKPRKDTDKDK